MPPVSNTGDPAVAVQTNSGGDAWYFATARAVTDLWGSKNDCGSRVKEGALFGIGAHSDVLECTRLPGCTGGADVVECLFAGGHWCGRSFIHGPILDFMAHHIAEGRKRTTAPPSTAATAAASSTRSQPTCGSGDGRSCRRRERGKRHLAPP